MNHPSKFLGRLKEKISSPSWQPLPLLREKILPGFFLGLLLGLLLGVTHSLSYGGEASSRGKPLRVLSIDGGGIRGLIPALILSELEERLGKPTSQLFDVVVGTSTGGLLALGLTTDPHHSPLHSASAMTHLYRTQGSKIFPNSLWQKLYRTGGLWRSRYDAAPLEAILKEKFGDYRLCDSPLPVGVTTFDTTTHMPLLLNSRGLYSSKFRDMPMAQAARATSAAPTYFDPCLWKGHSLIDGGISANNPSLVALWYAQHLYPHETYQVLSLGTGTPPSSPYKGGGLLNSGLEAIHLLQEGPMMTTEQMLAFTLNGKRVNYRRLQPPLGSSPIDLADASPKSIQILEASALSVIKSNSFKKVVKMVQGGGD
jgi:hypothetical protein